MDDDRTCIHCIYYYQQTCRRNPPATVESNGISAFPRVDFYDWCGEFKAMAKQTREPFEALPY
jgi:hypothetical protein